MRRRLRGAAGVGTLLALLALTAGCVRPPAAEAPPPTAKGRDIYMRRCAACHGVDCRGMGPVAEALRTPPPDLTRLAAANGGRFPRERVIGYVSGEIDATAHGPREMPVWGRRFEPPSGATVAAGLYRTRELGLLVTYLDGLQVP
jgi:mono/diheme cytochrome c family protein